MHPYTTRGELYRADVHHAIENRRLHEEFFPQRTDNLIAQLRKKGWYATVASPAFLLNGRKLADGDTVLLSDNLTLSEDSYIVYTTDGSCPVTWVESTLGEAVPQAILYSKENLAPTLPAGEVTLRAAAKSGSNWSATVTRKVFVVDEQADGIDMVNNERANSEKFDEVYDLTGRKINSSFTLHLTKACLS